nr:dynamin-related protein 5B-3 [Physcomitrium patens]BAH23785.1 dynamin-related protein 5B-3 [Physcomitrium patens]
MGPLSNFAGPYLHSFSSNIHSGSISSSFDFGFGMLNSSPNTLSTSRMLSPQHSLQSPSHIGQNLTLKPTKSKIPGNTNLPNGLTKHHQHYRGEPKDGFKDSLHDIFAENIYPSCGNEKLYEAYNELHSLAQDFHKPFDAPAIVVVGHQTDGKSALVEALMGFQFNHVGGGTKTRRPVTLHMKYNQSCTEPRCYLITEDRPPREEENSLEELQAYIEAENLRLEREVCQFWEKEIILKIEYKFCPNLTIIDTPGLISAAPGRKHQSLQSQAQAVESLVRTKLQHKEFIILCLEDSSDWSNATTRSIVMQVDPELSRTVIVSTKLDTRIPQFACRADVELFLRPSTRLLDGNILSGSPFFTSVPSGRVGASRDCVYRSNEHFREAVASQEAKDTAVLEEKLGRQLTKEEQAHVGVSRLRLFLEQLLQRQYLDSVPTIVPLLDREYRIALLKLQQTVQELSNLDHVKLKERGRMFRDSFLSKLSLLLRGTVVAPVDKFGESLQDERVRAGAFVAMDGVQMPYKHMPNANMRLYGGAQYHRAMAEFRFVVGNVKCPVISREEIVNACGVEDIHDGTNYFRTACVIAVAKARDVFEPFLHQLGTRLSHIIRRLLPISFFLLQKDREFLSGHDMFLKHVVNAFHMFVDSTERSCREKCMEDLMSTTRYVTWSLHSKNQSGLRQYLSTLSSTNDVLPIPTIITAAVPTVTNEGPAPATGNSNKQDNKTRLEKAESLSSGQSPQARLVDLLESTLWNRRLAPTSEEIVNALVSQIFEGIRDHCVASAEMKFNCFFLMPVVDTFPSLLREDLETAFEQDIDHVFDVTQARRTLFKQKQDLELEIRRVERIQEKFAGVHQYLNSSQVAPVKDISEEFSSVQLQD